MKLMFDWQHGEAARFTSADFDEKRREKSGHTLENASMLMPTVGVASTTAVFLGFSCSTVRQRGQPANRDQERDSTRRVHPQPQIR